MKTKIKVTKHYSWGDIEINIKPHENTPSHERASFSAYDEIAGAMLVIADRDIKSPVRDKKENDGRREN